MEPDEKESRQSLITKLADLNANLGELKSRFLSVHDEIELKVSPTRNEAWLLAFLNDYGLSKIDDWAAGVSCLLNDPSLLFSSQAIFWIGGIRGLGKAFDGVDWLQLGRLEQVSDRVVVLARELYHSIYTYRNRVAGA